MVHSYTKLLHQHFLGETHGHFGADGPNRHELVQVLDSHLEIVHLCEMGPTHALSFWHGHHRRRGIGFQHMNKLRVKFNLVNMFMPAQSLPLYATKGACIALFLIKRRHIGEHRIDREPPIRQAKPGV